MRPTTQPDQRHRYQGNPNVVPDRPRSSWTSVVALIVVLVALAAAILLLVRAGTDGIGAGPIVTNVVETGGN